MLRCSSSLHLLAPILHRRYATTALLLERDFGEFKRCWPAILTFAILSTEAVLSYFHFTALDEYNITACGLEKMHPFDSTKYRNIFNHLVTAGVLRPDQVRTVLLLKTPV